MAKRKVRWFIWIVLATLFVAFVATIHPFLARTAPVDGSILIVESWLWNRPALREALEEFLRGNYRDLVFVGSPTSGGLNGEVILDDAELAAIRSKKIRIDESKLVKLTIPPMKRHRTYAAAVMFRNWMIKNRPETKAVNIFTIGVHARRSQVSYQKALGRQVKVGVIVGTQTAYIPWRWWMSPTGIKLVFRNFIGFLDILIRTPTIDIGEM